VFSRKRSTEDWGGPSLHPLLGALLLPPQHLVLPCAHASQLLAMQALLSRAGHASGTTARHVGRITGKLRLFQYFLLTGWVWNFMKSGRTVGPSTHIASAGLGGRDHCQQEQQQLGEGGVLTVCSAPRAAAPNVTICCRCCDQTALTHPLGCRLLRNMAACVLPPDGLLVPDALSYG
jgi:hypothetical protein